MNLVELKEYCKTIRELQEAKQTYSNTWNDLNNRCNSLGVPQIYSDPVKKSIADNEVLKFLNGCGCISLYFICAWSDSV